MSGGRRGANYALALTGGTLTIGYYDVMEFLLQICFKPRNSPLDTEAMKQDGNLRARIERSAQTVAPQASRNKRVSVRVLPHRAGTFGKPCDETLLTHDEPSAGTCKDFSPMRSNTPTRRSIHGSCLCRRWNLP